MVNELSTPARAGRQDADGRKGYGSRTGAGSNVLFYEMDGGLVPILLVNPIFAAIQI